MYVNAVANSVTLQLYLRHDFYNIFFKIKRKLYVGSGLVGVIYDRMITWRIRIETMEAKVFSTFIRFVMIYLSLIPFLEDPF
jgi:hypothetical protein